MQTIAIGSAVPTGSAAEVEFQNKMKERMRQSFGDLMPDEVLAGIVARGIEEAFFTKTRRVNNYGPDVDVPAWTVTFIELELKARVADAVKAWIADNGDRLKAIVEERLSVGIASACVQALDGFLANEMQKLRNGVSEAFSRLRNGSGY